MILTKFDGLESGNILTYNEVQPNFLEEIKNIKIYCHIIL